jgi:hypothetical protein
MRSAGRAVVDAPGADERQCALCNNVAQVATIEISVVCGRRRTEIDAGIRKQKQCLARASKPNRDISLMFQVAVLLMAHLCKSFLMEVRLKHLGSDSSEIWTEASPVCL